MWGDLVLRRLRSIRRPLLLLAPPLLALPLPIIVPGLESRCAYTVIVMAAFWTCETLPLSVTALLPALLFPLLGVMKSSDVRRLQQRGLAAVDATP